MWQRSSPCTASSGGSTQWWRLAITRGASLRAAAALGVAPAACWALEDSHNGVRAAAAAGINVIMVPDLLAATAEMRALCFRVAADLHEVRAWLRHL